MGEFLWTTDKSTYSYFESICTLDYNVRSIDNRIIGDGKIGIITSQIQSLYYDVVRGKNDKFKKWCMPIYD